MGLQINFWMTEVDEQAFIDHLQENEIIWTPYAIKYRGRPKKKNWQDWEKTSLTQQVILIPLSFWKQLQRENISDPLFDETATSVEEFQKWTMVGTGASPCCEFVSCGRDSEKISPGLLFFHTDYFNEKTDEICVKQDESVRWFKRLTAWIRRQGKAGENKGQFIMPDAAQKLAAGELKLVHESFDSII